MPEYFVTIPVHATVKAKSKKDALGKLYQALYDLEKKNISRGEGSAHKITFKQAKHPEEVLPLLTEFGAEYIFDAGYFCYKLPEEQLDSAICKLSQEGYGVFRTVGGYLAVAKMNNRFLLEANES